MTPQQRRPVFNKAFKIQVSRESTASERVLANRIANEIVIQNLADECLALLKD